MAKFIDSFDFLPDNYIVAPRHEWRIMRMVGAKVTKVVPRLCLPACEFFRKDIDGGPLCYYECNHYIFDKHKVKRGEVLLDILFATNPSNPHEGFSWLVGEKYLRKEWGGKVVDRLIKQYNEFRKPADEGYTISKEDN